MSARNPERALYTPTKWKRVMATRRARYLHRWLIQVLGNACAFCGATWEDGPLEIDHVDGRDRANHSVETRNQNWYTRVRAYVREFYAGVRLRPLCKPCNSADGRRRQLEADAYKEGLEDAPF